MRLNLKNKWMFISYIMVIFIISATTLISGCSSDDSSINPVASYSANGRVNIYMNTVDVASVTYGHNAPQFFVENEIPLKYLKSIGLFVSRVSLIDVDGQKQDIYLDDETIPEPNIYLRRDYQNENLIFSGDSVIKATKYAKAEIVVDRVWVVYKNSDLGTEISWDDQDYGKTIVLNSNSALELLPEGVLNIDCVFDIGARVGTSSGEFYPFAYLNNRTE